MNKEITSWKYLNPFLTPAFVCEKFVIAIFPSLCELPAKIKFKLKILKFQKNDLYFGHFIADFHLPAI